MGFVVADGLATAECPSMKNRRLDSLRGWIRVPLTQTGGNKAIQQDLRGLVWGDLDPYLGRMECVTSKTFVDALMVHWDL